MTYQAKEGLLTELLSSLSLWKKFQKIFSEITESELKEDCLFLTPGSGNMPQNTALCYSTGDSISPGPLACATVCHIIDWVARHEC